MSIRKVLFPTDFSRAANSAWPHAVEFARRHEAQIAILHVATPYGYDPSNPEYQYLQTGNYEAYLQESMSRLSNSLGSTLETSTSIARDGSPAFGILRFLEENDADMIVMGTHGHSAITHFFLGSVAEKVVRYAPCPVLTVALGGDRYRDSPQYRNILVAFDFSEHAKEAARRAMEMASIYGARLQVLYVVEQEVHPANYYRWKDSMTQGLAEIEKEARKALKAALGGEGPGDLKVQVEIGEGRAHQDISNFAHAHQVDLVVMGSHGLSGIERMLLGSTTERLVRVASCPVLTIKLLHD